MKKYTILKSSLKNKIIAGLLFFIFSQYLFSQELEWNVDNTSSYPGERIVAVIDAGTIGNWDGIGIVGTVIDNNGNWGYNYPVSSEFTTYIKFSNGLNYGIIQETKTNNIILRLRKISDSVVHLTANLPLAHRGARVLFRKVEGSVSITMGSPTVIDTSGELVVDAPTYGSIFVSDYGKGNVGIGTTTPDSKLAVNGKIHAKEVKVDTGWSDFVFEESYKLPTLEEVEHHIQQKGHLKDIPSAKEVEENGIYLGEMDAKLLQKIEELTLYIIQQENKIKFLEQENKNLKSFDDRLTKIEEQLRK